MEFYVFSDIDIFRQQVIDKKVNRGEIVDKIYGLNDFRDVSIVAKFYLPSQSYGEVIEQWFRNKFDWQKISASDTAGDSIAFDEYSVEVKASLCDDGKICNYVQLRLTHDIDYYFLPTYDFLTDRIYFFLIGHGDMIVLVSKYGHYAHGTKKKLGEINENLNNPDVEFSIRPKIGNSCWLELMKYNVTEKQLYDRKIWKKKS